MRVDLVEEVLDHSSLILVSVNKDDQPIDVGELPLLPSPGVFLQVLGELNLVELDAIFAAVNLDDGVRKLIAQIVPHFYMH